MAATRAGYVEFGDRFHRFAEAHCRLQGQTLVLEGESEQSGFALCVRPCAAAAYAELVGKTWPSDDLWDDEDYFHDVEVLIKYRTIDLENIKLTCQSHAPEKKTLTFALEADGTDAESGFTDKVTCYLNCTIDDAL